MDNTTHSITTYSNLQYSYYIILVVLSIERLLSQIPPNQRVQPLTADMIMNLARLAQSNDGSQSHHLPVGFTSELNTICNCLGSM